MKYERIEKAVFLERENRFVAYVELEGKREKVHVKNTGRCEELLIPGAEVYLQKSENEKRATLWDLIAVKKGERLVNLDSQIPNRCVEEWLQTGNLFKEIQCIRPEITYGNSRLDLYAEGDGKKAFIEVKGVTLEEDGVCLFPDAPSERAVRHIEELIKAKKEGYEAILFFVIQMKEVRYFTPNQKTQPEFAEALKRAKAAGVKILAYDCEVSKDKIRICDPVDVVLESPQMKETVPLIVEWYRKNRRDLPWRKNINAYRVWISEIMLQQTRVEAVKPYYERFLSELPDIETLANVEEDKLLKLWEGLGYYNRARNLKLAAQQIMEQYGGKFPETYEKIRELKGIGNYTAGAIGSFVYDLQKPAVDGNVFRVVSRILEDADDILKASTRKKVESLLEEVIPKESPGDFNQGLIELGAIVCLPGGEPKCEICPVSHLCLAHRDGCELEYPVKKKAKERRVEKKTILRFCDNEEVAIRKRPDTGLLAGLYEFPNVEGHLKQKEVIEYAKSLGLTPVRVKKLPDAKHIFSHVEWQMKGYEVIVDELERELDQKIWSEQVIFAEKEELEKKYPMPSAFAAYQL